MRIRRTERCMSPIRTMIVFLSVVVVYAALGSVPASAARGHVFERSFGGPGSGAGQFEEPSGVAVDEAAGDWASGDVYVTTSSQERPEYDVVDVFKPEVVGKELKEKYVTQLTGTCTLPDEPVPLCPGSEFKPFEGPKGVAVDSLNGDVVVADEDVVDGFEPEPGMPGIYRYLFDITGTPAGSFEDVGGSEGVKGVTVDGGQGQISVWGHEGGQNVVDELRLAGGGVSAEYAGRLTGTPAGPFGEVRSVAVSESGTSKGDVFVGDGRGDGGFVDVFGPNLVIAEVSSGVASEVGSRRATLNGTVNVGYEGLKEELDDEESTGVAVEMASDDVYVDNVSSVGRFSPDGGLIERFAVPGGGGGALAVNSSTGTLYVVTSADVVDVFGLEEPGAPTVEEESVSDVTSESATLEAEVNPAGGATSYYFQYGVTSAYGSDVPAAPGDSIGSGEVPVEVSQHVQGLAPGTEYHYRVVAVSQISVEVSPGKFETQPFTSYGEDQTFTTQSGAGPGLIDGRGWEFVSPPDKHGAQIQPIFEGWVIQSSLSGDALTYVATAPTEAQPQGFSNVVQVLSTRGSRGWPTRDIAVAQEGASGATDGSVGLGQEYRFFRENPE